MLYELRDSRVRVTGEWRSMTPEEAIEESIKKWEFIAIVGEERCSINGINCGGRLSCALCKLFFWGNCAGCPIQERTGNGCAGTPYVDFEDAVCHADKLSAAQAEVVFLQSLHTIYTSDVYQVEYKDGGAHITLKAEFPEMSPLEAIRESIRKWEFVLAVASDPTFDGRIWAGGCVTCALCVAYPGCRDCPGNITPGPGNCCDGRHHTWCQSQSRIERVDAAVAMVKFLKDAEADATKCRKAFLMSGNAVPTSCVFKIRVEQPCRIVPPEPDVKIEVEDNGIRLTYACLLYTSPSPRDRQRSRMPSSA